MRNGTYLPLHLAHIWPRNSEHKNTATTQPWHDWVSVQSFHLSPNMKSKTWNACMHPRVQKPLNPTFRLQPFLLISELCIKQCNASFTWILASFSNIFAVKWQILCQVSLIYVAAHASHWHKNPDIWTVLRDEHKKGCNINWDFNVTWNLKIPKNIQNHHISPY